MAEAKKKQPPKKKHQPGNGNMYGFASVPRSLNNAPEIKCVDYYWNMDPVLQQAGTNTQVFPVNVILEGASMWNRVGRKVTMKSLKFDYSLHQNIGTVTGARDKIRVVLFYDRQTNGATPTNYDVIQGVRGDGTTVNDPFVSANLTNRERFLILRDDKWNLAPVTTGGSSINKSTDLLKEHFVQLKNLDVVFKANAGTIGDVATGGLFVMVQGDNATAPNAAWVFRSVFRLRYTDV